MSFSSTTRALSSVATCVLIMTLPSGTAARQIASPDPSHLAPGYSVDPNGCVVGPNSAAVPPVLPPDGPAVRVSYQGTPGAQARYRAQYAEYRHDLLNAVALRRRELQSSTDDEVRKDAEIRLPLSVDLARLGNLMAARHIWRAMLARRSIGDDSAFDEIKKHRYDAGLQKLRSDMGVNPMFEDSGAAAHLQRGVLYANQRDFDRATREWRLAVHCSPNFDWPHLLLGIVQQLRHRPIDAQAEWLLTLEGWEVTPGPAIIDIPKYEALTLLIN